MNQAMPLWFLNFPNISKFLKILSFKLFSNSLGNWFIKFIMIDLKPCFTCSIVKPVPKHIKLSSYDDQGCQNLNLVQTILGKIFCQKYKN